MHEDEHGDVVVDLRDVRSEVAHGEELPGLREDGPWFAHLARGWIETGAHRQTREPADHGLLRIGELVDEPGDVVFEELLAGRIEEGDGGMSVRGVRAGEPEVQLPAALTERRTRHAELGRAILVPGEGLRIDHLQVQLASERAASSSRNSRTRNP